MMLSLCGVILLMYGTTIFLGMRTTNSIVKTEAMEKTDHLASHYSDVLKKEVEHAMETAQAVAHTYEGLIVNQTKPDQESLNAVLRQLMERNPNFLGIWVVLDPGSFFEYPYVPYFYREDGKIAWDIPVDMEYFTQEQTKPYYALPKQQRKEVLIEPYEDGDIHIMMTSTAVPIIANGKFAGSVGIDLSLESLTKIVSQITPYETGIASLISNSGIYIAHPDTSKINKKFDENQPSLKAAAQAIKEGKAYRKMYFSKILQEDVYRIFLPVHIEKAEAPWSFSVEVPMQKVLQRSQRILWVCIMTGMVSLLIAVCVIFLIASSITKPIKQTAAGLKDIAQGEGDLTMRLAVVSEDELGELASWFNLFMEKMQTIIARISENTNQVDGASRELSGIAEELFSQADNTSDRANNVATATEELNVTVTSIAAAMEQSTTNASMVASSSEQMTATISQVADNVGEASQISASAVTQAQKTAEKMGELEETAQNISQVTETIADISDKTNLLALNATIEAARAGEAGKGFAVVATEIKELAAQTTEAANDIKNQIDGIQATSNMSISAIDEIVTIINQINDIIGSISTAVDEQSSATQEITSNIAQANQGLIEINENMNQGSAISGEISQDITQVSQAAGQIAGKSSEVTAQAAQLEELSTALKEIVNSFKI